MNQPHEYLLGIAESIIDNCADAQSKSKYNALKQKLIKNANRLSQGSAFTIRAQPSQSVFKESSLNNTGGRRCNTRQSNKSKTGSLKLRDRVLSSCSKNIETYQQTSKSEKQALQALKSVTNLIKNAQKCPSLLSTITFDLKQYSRPIRYLVQEIASSLTSIHATLIVRNIQKKQIIPLESNQTSLKKDNKWLITKLQTILQQNTVLRRMIGRPGLFA